MKQVLLREYDEPNSWYHAQSACWEQVAKLYPTSAVVQVMVGLRHPAIDRERPGDQIQLVVREETWPVLKTWPGEPLDSTQLSWS